MLKFHEIRELIKTIDQSALTEFEYEFEAMKISIKKGDSRASVESVRPTEQTVEIQQPVPTLEPPTIREEMPVVPGQVSDRSDWVKITAPMVGTYYSSPEPGVAPFVKLGDKVQADSVVCILEAMKLFNEIEAQVSGEIVEILVKDGELVEYGQPLFLVKP